MARGATKTRRKSSNEVGDLVNAIRASLGKQTGRKLATRAAVAELLGSSPASLFNWERGATVPSQFFLDRMREALDSINRGTFTMPAAAARRPGRPGRPPKGAAPVAVERNVSVGSSGTVTYANVVSVERGGAEIRLRFGLAIPGTSTAQSVADIVIPAELVHRIARG
jgi:hypothetical protein